MKAWQIFTHSLRQVFGNKGAAVRVSLLPFVGLFVALIVLGGGMMFSMMGRMEAGMEGGMGAGGVVAMLALVAVYIGAFTLIAVNWHRFILLNEPVGWLPQVRTGRMMAYFGTALLVGLITFGVALIIVFVAASLGAIGWLIGIPLFVVVLALSFRLSTSLPGAALGQGGGIAGSMAATRGQTGTLIALTLIYFTVSVLCGIVVGLLSLIPVLGILISLAFQWLAMMVALSMLTTLYGHYVEKRELT